MWRHHLLTLYRSMSRHRLYAALNVLGLAVGIAVFLVLSLYVAFETSFERWIPQARSIYLIRETWTLPGHTQDPYSISMGGLLDELTADDPTLVGTRVWNLSTTVRQGRAVTAENLEVVDPNFFTVFDLPLASGDKARALSDPDDVVLTQTRAKRYFGAANPLGKPLTLAFQGQVHTYRVAGVLKDLPHNTDLTLDLMIPLTRAIESRHQFWTEWGDETLATYLKFDTPAAAAAQNARFDAFTDLHAGPHLSPVPHRLVQVRATPLLDMHLINPKDQAAVAILAAVGVLTLLLAGMNYVNLATARAGLRAREVALRKVMGAAAPSLVGQFIAEAVVTAIVAAVIGLGLCLAALPFVNTAEGLPLQIDYDGRSGVLPALLGFVIAVSSTAGIYPAFVLSRFQPASVFAAVTMPGGGRASSVVREALVTIQFAIAIAFIASASAILGQAYYLRHADLGFQRDGLIVVSSFNDSEMTAARRAALLDRWRRTPGVRSVAVSDMAPGNNDNTTSQGFHRPDMANGQSLNWMRIGPGFTDTYGVRLAAGRLLDARRPADDSSPAPGTLFLPFHATGSAQAEHRVMLNAKAARLLGFPSPQAAIGQTLLEGRTEDAPAAIIVGVIDDVRFRSPREQIPPTVFYFWSKDIDVGVAAARYAGADPAPIIARMADAWRAVAPDVPFRAKTIDENLQPYYTDNDQRGRLFTAGALLAVLIACVGLYGLAAFNTQRRTKEIGIRKTLGASLGDVLLLLLSGFVRPVLLANLIAWPLAYAAMTSWLSAFDQRIALSPVYFLIASALAALIAVLTVTGQVLKVARAEPAKALRYE